MKLHKLKIEGFRKIKNAEIVFGDTTFLIGENNAVKYNKSILEIIETEDKRLMMCECIEEELGYQVPNNKPYTAYKFMKDWNSWDEIPKKMRDSMVRIFDKYFN